MLAPYYTSLLLLHVFCVALSGSLFLLRGVLKIRGSASANAPALRIMAHGIDTVLLVAAVLLTMVLHQYPFFNDWLTVKVLLLAAYVALGTLALKGARTPASRSAAFLAALATFAFILGVAITHRPAGWLSLMQQRTAYVGPRLHCRI